MERGVNEALASILRRDGRTEKQAVYREGKEKLRHLQEYAADLKAHEIKTAELVWEGDSLLESHVSGQWAMDYFM